MEIYINPLTPEKLAALIDQAKGSPDSAQNIQKTLHFALRNLIWAGNADGITDLVETYPEVNLDRTYEHGSLLCYAAAAPLLARGGKALAPLEALLQLGADPFYKHAFRLRLTEPFSYRGESGDFNDYLNHMATALRDAPPTSALAVSVGGQPQKALGSLASIKSLLSALFPQHSFKRSSPSPAKRPRQPRSNLPDFARVTGLLYEATRPQCDVAQQNQPILIGSAPVLH